LIVAEGLITYLDEKEAWSLAEDLSRQSGFRRWVFDLMFPWSGLCLFENLKSAR
jgi:O-methyltransferase involved in polyketide biosynthesis